MEMTFGGAARVRVAQLAVLVATTALFPALFLGCDSDDDVVADAGVTDQDARFVPVDGGDPGDAALAPDKPAVQRDAAPYERPPQTPAVSGHGWSWKSLGTTPAEGGSMRMQTNDRLLLRAGGAGIGGGQDGLGVVYTKLEGDGEIVARVRSLQMTSPQAMAGVIIRADDADPGAPSVFLGIFAVEARGGAIVARRTAQAAAEAFPADPQIRAGQFLKIRREGRRFTCYRSVDRLGWVRLGAVEVDMPVTVVAGVAASAAVPPTTGPDAGVDAGVDAGTSAALTAAEFDQLRLLQLDSTGAALALDLEPVIGNGVIASVAGGVVNITAGGDQLLTTGEPATWLLAPVSGSLTITARIDALGGPMASKARVGLTFREGGPARVSPFARHAMISLDAAGTLAFQKRDRSTNADLGAMVAGVKPPCWLRLARYDDPQALRTRVMGSYSRDGITFVPLDTVDLAMPDPVLGGILFSSGDQRVHETARLSAFGIAPTTTPIAAPSADAGTGPTDAGGGS